MANRTKQPIFVSIDDTVNGKTKPLSQAKNLLRNQELITLIIGKDCLETSSSFHNNQLYYPEGICIGISKFAQYIKKNDVNLVTVSPNNYGYRPNKSPHHACTVLSLEAGNRVAIITTAPDFYPTSIL